MTTTTSSKIICDSVSPAGHRLTTFECVFPRIILAEVNTHKMLSKNSASSRAIPVEKMIARVLEDPYVPTHWGANQKGMQASEQLSDENDRYEYIDDKPDRAMQYTSPRSRARGEWYEAVRSVVGHAKHLLEIGLHKQLTNRWLEPAMWHTALISGTEWSNFFNLRDNKDAHPDFRDLAHAMRELYASGNPSALDYGDWHLPLVSPAELFDMQVVTSGDQKAVDAEACKVSVGRCARVSYLTHDGKRDRLADVELCERLLASGHMSPFEHVARPMAQQELEFFKQKKVRWVETEKQKGWEWIGAEYSLPIAMRIAGCPDPMHHAHLEKEGEYTHFLGNLNGWVQYRKLIPHEEDILGARS